MGENEQAYVKLQNINKTFGYYNTCIPRLLNLFIYGWTFRFPYLGYCEYCYNETGVYVSSFLS